MIISKFSSIEQILEIFLNFLVPCPELSCGKTLANEYEHEEKTWLEICHPMIIFALTVIFKENSGVKH